MLNGRPWQVAVAAIVALAMVVRPSPAATRPAAPAPAAVPKPTVPPCPWPVKKEGEDYTVVTPHYQVRTDLGPEAAVLIALQQEALYAELLRRMGDLTVNRPTGRTNVAAVKTQKRFTEISGEEKVKAGGLYVRQKNLLIAWGGLSYITSAMRHEGTHQFVHVFIGANCPVWLNEGLAEFYEAGVFENGRLEVGRAVTRDVLAVRDALAKNTHIPLRKMVAIDSAAWAEPMKKEKPGEEVPLQYHEAWLMVHFLAYGENGKYRLPFQQYIGLVARGWLHAQAWEMVFGKDYAAFEARWRAHIDALVLEADCADRMRMLGWFASGWQKGGAPVDLERLRTLMVGGKMGKWRYGWYGAEEGALDAAKAKELATLFRCPFDTRPGDAISYEVEAGAAGEPPAIVCKHHKDIVRRTAGVPDDKGNMVFRVVDQPLNPTK